MYAIYENRNKKQKNQAQTNNCYTTQFSNLVRNLNLFNFNLSLSFKWRVKETKEIKQI